MLSTRAGLLLALLPLVGAGCSSNPGADDGGAVPAPPVVNVGEGVVVVQNLSYNPARIETTAGKEIVWRFSDNGLAHSVTADDGSFDSGRQPSGEFKHAFNGPAAEIGYHCQVHSGMRGRVVVSG